MDNNQLYWLAGIIDGEGGLTFNKRQGIHKTRNNGKGHFSFITRVHMGNTDMEIIRQYTTILCQLGVKFYYYLRNPDIRFYHAKRYIVANVEGYRSVKKLLEAIIDKLQSGQKQKQARIMLDYCNYRLKLIQERQEHGYLTSKIREEDFIKKDIKIVEEFKKLNKYQIDPSTTKRKASSPLSW